LLYQDQPGINLGTFNINTTWQVITVNFDQQYLNKGINKLSFIFSGIPSDEGEGYADFDYIEFLK
ncbi:MAG: hypothetical protein MN733_03990, partial [Nitrososphaera sp.]|nr:hypothetical protein [Nitrososphaera sp.]